MTTFNSFEELAKVFGCKLKAKEKMEHGSYITVEAQCGKKAVVIWSIISDRESTKMYGPRGNLILTPEEICAITGYERNSVVSCLITLIRNGFIRPANNGQAVKAA